MKKKFIIMLSVLCLSLGVNAHQPDLSTTMLVEQGENNWVLQVRAALTAFEYAIEQHYGKDAYATPEEFQTLVIKHLQEHVSILFNDVNPASLENGMVKLGHETSVTFGVVGAPKNLQALAVKNSGFNTISRNQSALIVIKEGFDKEQFILNNKNDHAAKLKVKGSKFELVTSSEKESIYLPFILGGSFLALIFMYFAYKKRQNGILTTASLIS